LLEFEQLPKTKGSHARIDRKIISYVENLRKEAALKELLTLVR
jgi:hypothetical protein